MTGTFLELHVLQTLPYSNVNRDDLGSPKMLVYGGEQRTRVSSQSWKRPVRLAVEQKLGDHAARTRRLPGKVAEILRDRGWPDDLAAHAGEQVRISAGKAGKPIKSEEDGGTSVLFYLPVRAFRELADLAEKHRDAIATQASKKKPEAALPTDDVLRVLKDRNGTINLLGRMLAELPATEVDGAVQFAHAFTTHGTEPEIDFFTAVDDIPSGDAAKDRGSAHMNSAEFSTGVFYRYACVDLRELLGNLDGDTATAKDLVQTFAEAFLSAMPTGKKNSTAPGTLPDLAYLSVRTDRPINLAPAFEQPVRAEADGWGVPSRRRLGQYAESIHRLWGEAGIAWHGYACVDDKPLPGLGTRHDSYAEVIGHAVQTAYDGAK